MDSETLFPIEEIPEVPLLREPSRVGARQPSDARFRNDYPPEWNCCLDCEGTGREWRAVADFSKARALGRSGIEVEAYGVEPHVTYRARVGDICSVCLGMGSVKARVRFEAGHRCERCKHPYVPKGDALMFGVEPSWREGGWSACDVGCLHGGPVRALADEEIGWETFLGLYNVPGVVSAGVAVEAAWRILTVHHLDGDKANLRWWNLAALCQRCHLEIQAKVVMERVYPHEHSEWFKPHAAGYYASVYLCSVCGEQRENPESHHTIDGRPGSPVSDDGYYPHAFEPLELTREETMVRLDELLALERLDVAPPVR